MSPALSDRRAALRERLTDAAEARIAAGGLASLRARDLAQAAGCSVGAIYGVFADLDDLVLAANARTFARLGRAVTAALVDAPADPRGRLVAMARAYHAFAAANTHAWRALFDLQRPPGVAAPAWYRDAMEALLALIDPPLDALFSGQDAAARGMLARTLFSAVHGIVLLGLDDAGAGVPRDRIDAAIALLLDRIGPPPPG